MLGAYEILGDSCGEAFHIGCFYGAITFLLELRGTGEDIHVVAQDMEVPADESSVEDDIHTFLGIRVRQAYDILRNLGKVLIRLVDEDGFLPEGCIVGCIFVDIRTGETICFGSRRLKEPDADVRDDVFQIISKASAGIAE